MRVGASRCDSRDCSSHSIQSERIFGQRKSDRHRRARQGKCELATPHFTDARAGSDSITVTAASGVGALASPVGPLADFDYLRRESGELSRRAIGRVRIFRL